MIMMNLRHMTGTISGSPRGQETRAEGTKESTCARLRRSIGHQRRASGVDSSRDRCLAYHRPEGRHVSSIQSQGGVRGAGHANKCDWVTSDGM